MSTLKNGSFKGKSKIQFIIHPIKITEIDIKKQEMEPIL